jgi:hypothetical protein
MAASIVLLDTVWLVLGRSRLIIPCTSPASSAMPRVLAGASRPVLLLNIAVLVATPIQGGHHLVDFVGGAMVAVLPVELADWIVWARDWIVWASESVESATPCVYRPPLADIGA